MKSSTKRMRPPRRQRMLVFAPDDNLRAKCVDMLRTAGLQVRAAATTGSAWASLLRRGCDLVLIGDDTSAEAAGGFLHQMRSAGMNMPAVYLRTTSSSGEDSASNASEFDAVLTGSFSYFELLSRVVGVLAPDSRDPFEHLSFQYVHED